MARELGVGRSAVRTALARLEHEGLVEHERHRGARVRLVGARGGGGDPRDARCARGAGRPSRGVATPTPERRARACARSSTGCAGASTPATCSAPPIRTRCCTVGSSRSRGHAHRGAADRHAQVPARPLPVPDDPAARAAASARSPSTARSSRRSPPATRRRGAGHADHLSHVAEALRRGWQGDHGRDQAVRPRPRTSARRLRHPHAHLARRGRAQDRRHHARPAIPRTRHGRVRAEVPLRLDGRARGGGPRRRPRDQRARRDRAQPCGRRHQPARGRDRRARGRPDRLASDRRLGQRVARAGGARRAPRSRCGSSSNSNCASRASRSRRCRSCDEQDGTRAAGAARGSGA